MCLNSVTHIPGFYYDKMKKKYFRILPGQSNVMSSVVTKDVLRSRQAEDKRKDALYRQETSIGHGPQPVRKSLNLINILHRYETDCVRQSCKHEFARCLASGLRPRAQQKVYDVDMLHSYNTLQHMTSMQPNESANSLLCIWSLKHIMGHRIHALQVSHNSHLPTVVLSSLLIMECNLICDASSIHCGVIIGSNTNCLVSMQQRVI